MACVLRSGNKKIIALALVIAAVAATGWFLRGSSDLLEDENAHFHQVEEVIGFVRGDSPFEPRHPAIPGYHAVLALGNAFRPDPSISFLRAVSLLLCLASVAVFFILVRKQDSSSGIVKTLQYFFFPLVFNQSFLLYTEVPSLLTVLLMAWAAQRRRGIPLGAAGLLSILFRQNNIFWLLFFVLLLYFEKPGPLFRWKKLRSHALEHWPSAAVAALFGLFVLWNGGVAIFDQGSHPLALHFGNIYTIIFTSFLLFLPFHVANAGKIARLVRRFPQRFVIGLVVAFLLYMQTYVNTHPYNQDWWELRNIFLLFIMQKEYWKALAFFPIAYAILSHVVTPLYRTSTLLLYPAAVAFLAMSWLIEPRYYFIPLVLFHLYRHSGRPWQEYLLLAWNVAGSAFLFWGLYSRTFLP